MSSKKELHLDIETYSSVDLKKAGVYVYSQSLDFEILLLAYAFDEDPVTVLDLASGDKIPEEVEAAFFDKNIIKTAHNANFERVCLAAAGYTIPIKQWFCTSVKAAYCGLPLGLGMLSKALKLGEFAKDASGTRLIKFFTMPCKPTKKNGGIYRNLAEENPEDWESFIEYCRQDVVAERKIAKVLKPYPIPREELENYWVDQKINDTGIRIDLDLVQKAVQIDETGAELLLQRMKELTNLENPNSPSQLKGWLSDAMKKEINSIAKGIIAELLLETDSEAVREVLQLRKRASKTSTKKYVAMLNSLGDDFRIRGILQFYGANRTGRWAGRIVQVQNLPKNVLEALEVARKLVKLGDYELLNLLYPSVTAVLSQLIRTAFVPKEGYVFAVADYSSIEARVISWLAGEEWRLEVFRTHGKIYEASAAMMFNVPLESIEKGSDLRAKGKVAELALGFQGAVGALKNMGGEKMGLSESEMLTIVKEWRRASPKIRDMWYTLDKLSKQAVKYKKRIVTPFQGVELEYDGKFLTIKLASGRKLFYYKPHFGKNSFGNESLKYWGVDQTTKHWTSVDTYGGKLTENIVQATARDILASAMFKLSKNYNIVMHVHDEVIIEIPIKDSEKTLVDICEIMSEPLPWATDLPTGAEGYLTKFYKKD